MYQTALARREDDQALLGSFDVTPTFAAQPSEIMAGVFPELRTSWSEEWTTLGLLAGATAITTRRRLADHLAVVSGSISQTIVDVAEQMWVLLRAEPADVIGDLRTLTPPTDVARIRTPSQAALAAVSDIQKWLAIGQDEVAALAGYAPRSVKNWREGMAPYPATVRRLFDVHALIGSLNRTMGTEGARLWLADSCGAGGSRRECLADDTGLRSVIAEATATFFEAPTVVPVNALDFDEEAARDVGLRPGVFSGPVRPVRRRS